MSCEVYGARSIGGGLCRVESGAYKDAVITETGVISPFDPGNFFGISSLEFLQYAGESLHSCPTRFGQSEIHTPFDRKALAALRKLPNMSRDRASLSLTALEVGGVCMKLDQPAVNEGIRNYLSASSSADLSAQQIRSVILAMKN